MHSSASGHTEGCHAHTAHINSLGTDDLYSTKMDKHGYHKGKNDGIKKGWKKE
jgi:hypothetical protein